MGDVRIERSFISTGPVREKSKRENDDVLIIGCHEQFQIRVRINQLRRVSDHVISCHDSDRVVRIKSHVSQESLNDLKTFIEKGHGQLELNETNFDDLYLLNSELKCHLDQRLMKYADEYFQVDKHRRILECLRKRVRMNNVTSDLEARFQKALCESYIDISDLYVQECVQDIGLSVFVRIFAKDDHKLVREKLDHVIDFVLWFINRDDLFGSLGSYLLKGVDVNQVTNPQMKRILDNEKLDKSVLSHEWLEANSRNEQRLFIFFFVLLVPSLFCLFVGTACMIDGVRQRDYNKALDARNKKLERKNNKLKEKIHRLRDNNNGLEEIIHVIEDANHELKEQIRDLEAKKRGLKTQNDELIEKNHEHEKQIRELETKNDNLEKENKELRGKHDKQIRELARNIHELQLADNELQAKVRQSIIDAKQSMDMIASNLSDISQTLQYTPYHTVLLLKNHTSWGTWFSGIVPECVKRFLGFSQPITGALG